MPVARFVTPRESVPPPHRPLPVCPTPSNSRADLVRPRAGSIGPPHADLAIVDRDASRAPTPGPSWPELNRAAGARLRGNAPTLRRIYSGPSGATRDYCAPRDNSARYAEPRDTQPPLPRFDWRATTIPPESTAFGRRQARGRLRRWSPAMLHRFGPRPSTGGRVNISPQRNLVR